MRVSSVTGALGRAEGWLSIGILALMSAVPLIEIAGRKLAGGGIPGSIPVVQYLTLWVAFLGAALAGAAMDIYSAMLVIVPLIAPMGLHYGIDPVHLGIVFLANMELGYLMPPMGENLFLSSYRFKQSLAKVIVATVPYSLMLLAAVLLITYLPYLIPR